MRIVKTKKGIKFLSHHHVYKKLIDHMNEAVWLGDKDERTVYVNQKFAKMLGYKPEEMMGRESYDFWDKESGNRVRNINATDRRKGISSSYEGNLLTKDGKKIPVLLSGSPFPGGGTIGIMTDLTELKKKEEKEKILTKAMKLSSDAIITFDKSLKIQTWNKGAQSIFGYSKKAIVNSQITKIFSKEEISKIIKSSKTIYKFRIKGKHKNKKNLIISATLTPVLAENKKDVQLYLLIARDETKQIEFEEELEQKFKKVKEAYKKLGSILYPRSK